MLAVAHPPLGVCLFLSLFAVSGQFSLLPSCHTKTIIKIQASLTAHCGTTRRGLALIGNYHGTPPPSPTGIYNAVLRSDLWALPALDTGHRLGIQNAPAGGPLQITDHRSH